MTTFAIAKHLPKLGPAFALALAACAMPAVPPAASQASARLPLPFGHIASSHPDRGPSWIAAGAASSGPLLYISDLGNFDVDVYSVASLKLVERITGFFEPEGACSDARGDVWIANTGAQQLLEFKPGSKTPVATLADPVGYPVGCAVNARNGDLAVADLFGISGDGDISIYRDAGGTPTLYANPNQSSYYLDGYDAKGNLYASGTTAQDTYSLSILPAGKKTMSSVSIKGATLHYPGSVLWTGSALVLGDQECEGAKTSCLYEGIVSGTTLSITKKIPLDGSCDVIEVALLGKQLFGGNDDSCAKGGKSTTDRWAYPAGGKPLEAVDGVQAPIGAAITSK
jgi:hypothetical protein